MSYEPWPAPNMTTSWGWSRAASLSTYAIAWRSGHRVSFSPIKKITGATTVSVKWIGLRSAIRSGTWSGVPPMSARS